MKSLKKLTFAATVAAMSFTTFAATQDTLLLEGQVGATLNISVAADANATALNITGGESDTQVAVVTEESNNLAGYKVFMSSANAGELRNTSDPSQLTTYQINYDGSGYITPPLAASAVEVKDSGALPVLTTDTSNVLINVSSYALAPAGTYQDTVTFSIIAN